jgi:diaminopimelate epimerase
MKRRFEKMHGLGNDFAIFDAREAPLAMDGALARSLADRHTGIGCDQLIVLEASEVANVRMRIWNADGSEVGACGNASRCVAMLLGGETVIETGGGTLTARAENSSATVDMGEPLFEWDEVPLAYPMDTADMPVGWEELQRPHALNVGNPHVVFFVEDGSAIDLARVGPVIENDPLFPERVNVGMAEVLVGGMNVEGVRRGGIALRVWERGAGLTRACGTAACAAAVAAIRYRGMNSPVGVRLPGGDLKIEWQPGGTIRMTGAASHVYSGEIAL